MKYIRNTILIIVTFIILLCTFISCNKVSSNATIDNQIFFSVPKVNLFTAPFIKNQIKAVTISYTKDWVLKYDVDWLEVSSTKGLANVANKVLFSIGKAPNQPGTYETEVRVESKDETSYKILPVTLNVINKEADQAFEISFDFQINDFLPQATEYYSPSAKAGLVTRGGMSPNGDIYDIGDSCIIVSAEFKNNTDNDNLLLVTAEGYNESDVQTSWCLSSGPLVGLASYELPAHRITNVELMLSWTQDIARVFIKGSTKEGTNLIDPIPATPIPESEMVHIWFDKEWFHQNDVDPDLNNVRITFPKRWIETGKSDSYNGTDGIELVVPRQLLLDDNESTNPDEITVYFPNYYFNGLPDVPLPK